MNSPEEKDIKGMSNAELDKLYASLANGCADGTPSETMKEIEKEMESRYDKFHAGK